MTNALFLKKVLVTGGAGYVGAVLVPKLLDAGHEVTNVDLYMFGDDVLAAVRDHVRLKEVKGDIRNESLLAREITGHDALIHLACISNDPSYELNPKLSKSVNYDATVSLVRIAKSAGVRRFIFASTSSVYGVKEEEQVTEDLKLEPLTEYSKYKALCERVCLDAADDDFEVTVLRPATVCGYSPRQRLDVIVNMLTNHAVNTGRIRIFGGNQYRPNIHITDMADLYVMLLSLPDAKAQRGIFNAGYENRTVEELAQIVRKMVGERITVERLPTNDRRSYRVNSDKIRKELGFAPRHTVEEAVTDLKSAFEDGRISNPMTDKKYYNIERMKELNLEHS